MGSSRASSEYDRTLMLEAAEALTGLADVADHLMDESNDGYSSSHTLPNYNYEVAKIVKDEHNTELRLNPAYPTNCVSSGRKSRQNLSEAELEARKIRRVLANRESARQTIRRRQAVFEELRRKAVDLAWENENLKMKKNKASKQYDSLKAKNECLKAQMMNHESKETQEKSINTNEQTISASSTNSSYFNNMQPSFLPFVWPNSVQVQCGRPARVVLPSHIKPSSSSCEEACSVTINGSGTPLYLLPYPCLFTLPQSMNENRPRSFNLNDKPKESCECHQFFPKLETPTNKGFPPDGGGKPTTNLASCEELLIEHDDTNSIGENKQIVGGILKIHQVPGMCSGKRSCDTAATSEARKRRKQLTRLKNHFRYGRFKAI